MHRLKLKEIMLITLVVPLMFVLGFLLTPLMSIVPLPPLKALIMAPIYSVGITVTLYKAPKYGIITALGFLLGGILSMFSILMLLASSIAALITDILCGVALGGYKKDRNILLAASLFPSLQVPLVFVIMAYAMGGVFKDLLAKPLIIAIPTAVTFLLGYFSAFHFLRMWKKRKNSNF